MAVFTNETAVRVKFQLADTTLVTPALIEQSIEDAHAEVLRFLAPEVDTESPEDALVVGETLLAGAHVYRSLAAHDAANQKHIAIGANRIEAGKRFEALNAIAEVVERQAWYILEPYVAHIPARSAIALTESTPVMGEA
ncbi:MAG: hypothetical protein AMXMBFR84_29320 [Candidatus Hydrogenedentota bacterium]